MNKFFEDDCLSRSELRPQKNSFANVKVMKHTLQPILFIHGAGGGDWEWEYWKTYFASFGYTCYAPTLTGNKKNLADVGISDYIKQLQRLTKKLKQKPIIIGASMGGWLAQKIGEIEPVSGIILVNSCPPKGVAAGLWPTKKYSNVPDIIKWSTESTIQDTIDCMPEATKKTIIWAHPQWRDESGKVIRELRSGLPINKKLITKNILVIAGKNDVDITPAVSNELAKYYHADYFEFENVSHVGALLGKRWKDIATIVRAWIDKQ